MRNGVAFIVKTNGITHRIEITPIENRGWVVFSDGKLLYGGMVFDSCSAAMERMNSIKRNVTNRGEHSGFWEILDAVVPPIPMPTGAIVPTKEPLEEVPPNRLLALPPSTLNQPSKHGGVEDPPPDNSKRKEKKNAPANSAN